MTAIINEPLVSVLTTAYNREQFIEATINSVLASTFQDFELIIVDDCSTDNTLQVANKYAAQDARIKVYSNEKNLGDYNNRNKAASLASGKYIKYLDSDDIIYPHGLACMVNSMEQFPEAGYGLSAVAIDSQPYPVCINSREAYLEHFGGFGHFDRAPGSSIIRRDAFNSINGFSGDRMIGDYQLWFKLANRYPLVKFPRDLVWDRQHAAQESKSDYAQKEYDRLRAKVLDEALKDASCPLSQAEIANVKSSASNKALKQKIYKLYNKIF